MAVKIAVVGNCQVTSFVGCARAFLPSAEISSILLDNVLRDGHADALADAADKADIVFTQEVVQERFGELRTAELARRCRNMVLYPKIVFTGFHPDAIGIIEAKRAVQSPTGAYHSQILLAAFLSGRSLDQALGLFGEDAYQRLGYFDEFPKSLAHLIEMTGTLGFDLAPEVDGWMAHGAFMYTFNHPKIRMVASICRQAIAKTDLAVVEPDLERIDDIPARASRWPVYPEIARRLGLDEPFGFGMAARDGGGALSLEAFAERSYAIYAGLAPEVLAGKVRAVVLKRLFPEG